MKTLITIISLYLFSVVTSTAEDDPFWYLGPSAYELPRFANKLIALGEEGCAKKIEELWLEASDTESSIDVKEARERIGWLCRVLYSPTTETQLRGPRYGSYMIHVSSDSMTLSEWPRFPLIESDGVFFVFRQVQMLVGSPEYPIRYLDYCRENGVFRDTPLTVPTQKEAQRALETILESERWRRIEWLDATRGEEFVSDKPMVINFLKKQLEENKSVDTTRVSARRFSSTPDTLNLNQTFEL